jgi:hypothetical protein
MQENETIVCIYCKESKPPSKEHHLSEGLGTFKAYKPLTNKVCKECNIEIGKAEEPFLRTSRIGFLREYYNISSKKKHKEENPFYRGSHGTPAIKITGIDRHDGKQREWEIEDGGIVQKRALYLVDDEGKNHVLVIDDKIKTGSDLLKKQKEMGLENAKPVDFDASEEDMELVTSIMVSAFPKAKFEMREREKNLVIDVQIHFEEHDSFYRTLAKIAFHYFLTYFPTFTGLETEFEPIKRFIWEGGSEVVINHFIHEENEPILYESRKKGYLTNKLFHIIVIETHKSFIFGRIELFCNEDINTINNKLPTFNILIGKNPSKLSTDNNIGHIFDFYRGGKINGHDGVVNKLTYMKNGIWKLYSIY